MSYPATTMRADSKGADRPLPLLSIIVPTRNEARNIEPLLNRISAATQDISTEVIFVDDSTDNTAEVIQAASENTSLDVKLIVRPSERRNGLGMAVVEGIQAARSLWVCVMDGDLQHPPEIIPQLMETLQSTKSDLVAASRLAEGGSTPGLSWRRTLISRVLALGSRALFPRELRHVSDPLTGFFMFRRAAVDPEKLAPKGFKILLEILIRCPKLKVTEVPFEFALRNAGESKANLDQVVALFEQLFMLRLEPFKHLARFALVGSTGLLVNSLLIYLFTDIFGINYLVSAILSTQGSTLWNFAWTEQWVFRERQMEEGLTGRLLGFLGLSNASLLVRGPLLVLLVSTLGMYYVLANLLTLILMTLVRYGISDKLLWRVQPNKPAKTYYYNIHDIIRVRSMQRLPELTYFQTDQPFENPDLDVRVSRKLAQYRRPDSICYEELLGIFGFSVVINRSETKTEVVASPLIGLSPHVLYTNVVEALLRWMFVRKGYALMHGASISVDGQALFITAQTDTGKTTTILNLIRHNRDGIQFLSDDMSIFCPDGKVLNYPKPMTISQHTVHAIGGAPLTRAEWLFLKIQSRLHSREGRKVAMWLSSGSFPAATLNAIVQWVVPPPKYMVDRLIPGAQYTKQAELTLIALIERGPDYEGVLNEQETLDTLLTNAEDAYGFPPYPALAHVLYHWNGSDLRETERQIVAKTVDGLPALRIASPRYDWYKRIPKEGFAPNTINLAPRPVI